MKRTKLWKAFLLTAALTLGACGAVSAEEATTPTVDITKVYSLLNSGTTAPAQTFTFSVEPYKCTNGDVTEENMPVLKYGESEVGSDGVSIVYQDAITEKKEQTVNLTFTCGAETRVGEYVYKITENAGSTAGIEYSGKVIYAKVTVVNGETQPKIQSITYTVEGDKLGDGEGFENQYQAADLKISKKVTGTLGDKSKYFEVEVTLNGEEGKEYEESFAVSGGSYTENPTSITLKQAETFYLKNDETITIKNLPYGVTYTVVEKDYTESDGYDAAKYLVNDTSQGTTSVSGEAVDEASEKVDIINNKGGSIDTGVILDNIPYLILIAVVIAAAIFLVLRRRTNTDLD